MMWESMLNLAAGALQAIQWAKPGLPADFPASVWEPITERLSRTAHAILEATDDSDPEAAEPELDSVSGPKPDSGGSATT
jgi:hypothetical protein